MKTFDTFSKRILVAAVSISLLLLSLSAFLLTIQRVNASSPTQNQVYPTIIGIGVVNDKVYYGVYDGGGNYRLKSKAAGGANDLYGTAGLLK